MACIKWSLPIFTFFGRNTILAKHSPERSLGRNPRMDFFSLYRQSHPLIPLIEGPPPMYWPNTSRWCLAPCACTTTIYVCLLLLPRHSYHSYVILLCSAYKVVFISFGVRGVRAFGLTLPSFVLPWTRYSLSKGIYLYSPLDFHFCHFSCPSHRPYGC